MKDTKTMIWALLALAVIGGAYWATRPDYGPPEPEKLVASSPAVVDHIEITHRGADPVVLARSEGTWTVNLKGSNGEERVVPADRRLIGDALGAFMGVTIGDKVSSSRERHPVFGVTENDGTLVVAKNGETEVVSLVIGNVDSTGMNTYVRLRSGDEVVTLPGRIRNRFNILPEQWRKRDLVEIHPDDVARIVVTGPDASYTLRRVSSPGWEIVTPGKEGGETTEQIPPSEAEAFLDALGSVKARSFQQQPIPENGEPVLKIQWYRQDGTPEGFITFIEDGAERDRVLVANGPGGDTAVLNMADLGGIKKKAEEFRRPATGSGESPTGKPG